jgi:hypothetical protein
MKSDSMIETSTLAFVDGRRSGNGVRPHFRGEDDGSREPAAFDNEI